MKIFGTGWQRTGTTSLAKALKALGFKTLDYPKQLLQNIDHDVIREYDAFTDNPIPLLYRELDHRHPGSKFIHTIRDEESWLESVKWLFTVGTVKFGWDDHHVVSEIHAKLYGTSEFDEKVFLARYRRHNAEVLEYFADRPHDLLLLNVTQGEGFEKLSPFLGKEAPQLSFPHWNKKEGIWKVRLRQVLKRFQP